MAEVLNWKTVSLRIKKKSEQLPVEEMHHITKLAPFESSCARIVGESFISIHQRKTR